MQALIIKQDGQVYYIAELPKPIRCFPVVSEGQVELAIHSAILVKNQEYAINLICDKLYLDETTFLPREINKPYEFPYLKVRIEQLLSDPPITVAIIEKEKEEEGEDEMWINIHKEISISVIEAINTGRSLPRKESIEALKQQYKITKR